MERYQIGLHYSLEAQRKFVRGDIYRALQKAARNKPLEFGQWVRVCQYRYSHQPLNAYGSTIGAGGRFNYGNALDNIDAMPFPALYIGENRTVSFREYFGLAPSDKRSLTAEEFALTPKKPISIVYIDGIVQNVLDITRPSRLKPFVAILGSLTIPNEVNQLADEAGLQRRSLISSVEMMLHLLYEPNWRGWSRQHGLPSNSQLFGKLAWEAGFDAILYRSIRGSGRCLAIFPQNLNKSDTRIWLHDTPPPNVVGILDGSNWQIATAPG